MQATEIDFSPGKPSLSVTTRRRLTPQGTSLVFLQAVTQPLHSMQRSASQRNFIRAIAVPPVSGGFDLAKSRFGFLHQGHRIVAISRRGVAGFATNIGFRALGITIQQVLALEPPPKMVGRPDYPASHTVREHRLDLDVPAFRTFQPDPLVVLDATVIGVGWIDLDKHVLLQFCQPLHRTGFFTPAFILDQSTARKYQRVITGVIGILYRGIARRNPPDGTPVLESGIFGYQVVASGIQRLAMKRYLVGERPYDCARLGIAERRTLVAYGNPLDAPA